MVAPLLSVLQPLSQDLQTLLGIFQLSSSLSQQTNCLSDRSILSRREKPLLQLDNPLLETLIHPRQFVHQYLNVMRSVSKAPHVIVMLFEMDGSISRSNGKGTHVQEPTGTSLRLHWFTKDSVGVYYTNWLRVRLSDLQQYSLATEALSHTLIS